MYLAKQADFHLPSFLMIWSGTPCREAVEAAPIQKEWPEYWVGLRCRVRRRILTCFMNWLVFRGLSGKGSRGAESDWAGKSKSRRSNTVTGHQALPVL